MPLLLSHRRNRLSTNIFPKLTSTCNWLALSSALPRVINPNKPWFLRVCGTSVLKTLEKREIARNEQFLLFPQCFLPDWITFFHFHQI